MYIFCKVEIDESHLLGGGLGELEGGEVEVAEVGLLPMEGADNVVYLVYE